jgi:hypothetical protein
MEAGRLSPLEMMSFQSFPVCLGQLPCHGILRMGGFIEHPRNDTGFAGAYEVKAMGDRVFD